MWGVSKGQIDARPSNTKKKAISRHPAVFTATAELDTIPGAMTAGSSRRRLNPSAWTKGKIWTDGRTDSRKFQHRTRQARRMDTNDHLYDGVEREGVHPLPDARSPEHRDQRLESTRHVPAVHLRLHECRGRDQVRCDPLPLGDDKERKAKCKDQNTPTQSASINRWCFALCFPKPRRVTTALIILTTVLQSEPK